MSKAAIAILSLCFFFLTCQDNPYEQGAFLYNAKCSSCHMEDGSGLGANIPTLVKADYLEMNRSKLPCIIRHGIAETIVVNGTTYQQPMKGYPKLTEAEIANILNYVLHTWNSDLEEMSMREVIDGLNNCEN